LELIVNVGSMNEEDSEQGYAHFIEHLGFKSTKNFPNYEIVKELENIGCQYGPDVNASTHLLETSSDCPWPWPYPIQAATATATVLPAPL